MRRFALACAVLLFGCSTAEPGPGPSEDGMYSDEVGEDIDGVLVQCGNMLDANYYWRVQGDGPDQVHAMPVICIGSLDTPEFDLESAQLTIDKYEFPEWEAEIRTQCAAGCMDAHDPDTDQTRCAWRRASPPTSRGGDWAPCATAHPC